MKQRELNTTLVIKMLDTVEHCARKMRVAVSRHGLKKTSEPATEETATGCSQEQADWETAAQAKAAMQAAEDEFFAIYYGCTVGGTV